MRVLVTGGAGFVGSHACKALRRAGFEPVVYDDLSRGHAEAVLWGPLEIGDIRDSDKLQAVLRRHEVEAVMHFAALAYVGESFARADAYHDVNVAGAWSLLRAMREAGVDRLIFSSSCAVYGIPDGGVCVETAPVRPISPYGASKAAAEQLIAMQTLASGLRATILRYFNAAGADPDGEIGEDHEPETHLIPLAIRAALNHGAPLKIFGVDYPTRDGTAERDYVHVSDIAEAHVAALARLCAGQESVLANLCSGAGVSVFEVCAAVERVLGAAPRTIVAPARPGDPPRLVGAVDQARRLLGWAPRRPSLDQMVRDAAHWLSRTRAFAKTQADEVAHGDRVGR